VENKSRLIKNEVHRNQGSDAGKSGVKVKNTNDIMTYGLAAVAISQELDKDQLSSRKPRLNSRVHHRNTAYCEERY